MLDLQIEVTEQLAKDFIGHTYPNERRVEMTHNGREVGKNNGKRNWPAKGGGRIGRRLREVGQREKWPSA